MELSLPVNLVKVFSFGDSWWLCLVGGGERVGDGSDPEDSDLACTCTCSNGPTCWNEN